MKRKNQVKTVSRRTVGRVVGYGSIGLLLLLTFIMINPSAERDSYATCLDGTGEGECAVSALTQEVGVTTKTAIALATASKVKLPDVTPTSAGATSYASTKLAVSTNSREGYSIFLQTGTADGSLVGATSSMDDTSKITNTEKTGTLLSNLETNAYGYALSTVAINENTTYSHVPTSSTVIYNKSSNTEMGDGTENYPYGDEYYLAFGTKIGTSLPAGTYAGTVTVSAVANPLTVTSLYDISMMQEMTSSICENTKEGYTKQLIDTRDGKSYWVAKLKDGNCWMVQNLALDITEAGLRASDTDIEEDWNQDSTYPPSGTNSLVLTGAIYNTGDFGTYSWNFGESIQATPLLGKGCSSVILTGQTMGEVCSEVGFVDINNDWSSSFVAQDGNWMFEDGEEYSGFITLDKNAKTYDAHYLAGNYYQWTAAVAGTDAAVENGDASGSICPKNWKLPDAGSGVGSFNYLHQQYGLVAPIANQTIYDAIRLLHYTLVGDVYRYGGSASGFGRGAAVTTSTSATTASNLLGSKYLAYSLASQKYPAEFYVGRNEGRQHGYSVRCLAR